MDGKNDMPRVGRIEQLTTNVILPRMGPYVPMKLDPVFIDRNRQIERLARALAKRDGYQWGNFAANDEYVYHEEAKEMLDYMDTLEVE